MPNATRAVAAVTPLLTAAVTAINALSSSSVSPMPRAFSTRFRVQTWHPRVIVTAKRLKDLGVRGVEPLPEVQSVDLTPRAPRAAELTGLFEEEE